jgi:hypothetical protein
MGEAMMASDEQHNKLSSSSGIDAGAGGGTIPDVNHPTPTSQNPAIPDDLFCPQCGYNLRGLTSDRCPECGYSVDAARTLTSEIPWVHRETLGRFRAYWQTVALVMFKQKRFCDEIARPVSYADSQSFRWVTVCHVYLPVLLVTLAFYGLAPAEPFRAHALDWLWESVWPIAILHVCLLVFLCAATGLPSYFFHPRGVRVYLQNRAIALSYYACGSLAVVALPLTVGVIPAIIDLPERLVMICLLIAVLVLIAQLVGWWLDLIRITKRIVSNRPGRANLVAVCVPVLWLSVAGLIFVALPFGVSFVLVIIHSLVSA